MPRQTVDWTGRKKKAGQHYIRKTFARHNETLGHHYLFLDRTNGIKISYEKEKGTSKGGGAR